MSRSFSYDIDPLSTSLPSNLEIPAAFRSGYFLLLGINIIHLHIIMLCICRYGIDLLDFLHNL